MSLSYSVDLIGEGALILRFGSCISLDTSEIVLRSMARLDKRPVHGTSALPGYASLLVRFDPLKVPEADVRGWVDESLSGELEEGTEATQGRLVPIPVHYGGDCGPDVEEVMRITGLPSPDAVVQAHAGGHYRVYFLGFLGGFPYLGGLQEPLTAVPRLSTPRQRLPKGAVGIAAGQTGVYTISSPGGWHVIGRTPMKLFDPSMDPPTALRPGDLVEFVPATGDIGVDEEGQESPAAAERPWAEVVTPGPMTTVQDLGRPAYGRYGVSRAGAADSLAVRMGNAAVGNSPHDAALEVLMGGLAIRIVGSCVVAVSGADAKPCVKRKGTPGPGVQLRLNEAVPLAEGDLLQLGYADDGMRTYVCVRGGVDVPLVLNSRSTDIRGSLGGFHGRALKECDVVGRLYSDDATPLYQCVNDPLRAACTVTPAGRTWTLRILRGPPHPSAFSSGKNDEAAGGYEALLDAECTVSERCDRMAVCLRPEESHRTSIKGAGGQQLSEPCVSGTIQLPPDGNPVILLAEHQTTGGYNVPAVVAQADLWIVGQLAPGDRVRFAEATAHEAVDALRRLHAEAEDRRLVRQVTYKLSRRDGGTLEKIDLNADAGEGFDDAGLLKYVTSVNIACGGHVGTPESIAKTVALAAQAGAAIGAHPSFVDQTGFGRTRLDTSHKELCDQVVWQVSALDGLCRLYNTRVRYIKPHGALYHAVLEGGEQGRAVRDAADLLGLPLLLMPKSEWAAFGEGFAERAYDGDSLRPRGKPGAVIHDPAEAAAQGVALASRPNIHSICIHGDSPSAVQVAAAVRGELDKHYQVEPFVHWSDPVEERRDQCLGASSRTADSVRTFGVSDVASLAEYEVKGQNEEEYDDLAAALRHQAAPVIMNGYRTGEGVEPEQYPVARVCAEVERLYEDLHERTAPVTAYSKFAQGRLTYDEYIDELKSQLHKQGGGWVTVAPRDTCQQGNDSESAVITGLSRLNAEIFGVEAGCVGYEIGGAQYQAGLMRGFDPALVLRLGLPSNMPAHSLQRSQYVNGLMELPKEARRALFQATAEMVSRHYRDGSAVDPKLRVPWHPYNFHAGNFHDEDSEYSPQDDTTGELLQASCVPMPTWVFSPAFTLSALERWTLRQIRLFEKFGHHLRCVRIKNPGQGNDWTAARVWEHCTAILNAFKSQGMDAPVIYIHNHDFNGLGASIGNQLFKLAQGAEYRYLVIDAAYRKNGTHNDNTMMLSALNLSEDQLNALAEYNLNQKAIEAVLCRFNSRDSQMTPWDSDWAGGTEGSDIRIAKEFGLDLRKINAAKGIASEVFPLERAVTPFSEYKLRLGIAIMIEDGIKPKSADAVRAWVRNGGKLKVGGDVLVGLKRWETLVPKTPEVNMLLDNMAEELRIALSKASNVIMPTDIPDSFDSHQRFTALGFQGKGMEFVNGRGKNYSSLLLCPHIIHRRPQSLVPGTKLFVLEGIDGSAPRVRTVFFRGYDAMERDSVALKFSVGDRNVAIEMDAKAVDVATDLVSTEGMMGIVSDVPGELISYAVSAGEVLKEGQPLCTLESMKMEIVMTVPKKYNNCKVKSLPVRNRTQTTRGDTVKPGQLLVELAQ